VHQEDYTKKAVLDIPEYVADKIRREAPPDLKTGEEPTTFLRLTSELTRITWLIILNCTRSGFCLAHTRRHHKHVVHIDPSRPGTPISKYIYRRMIEREDKQRHDDTCEENKHAHLLTPKTGELIRGPGYHTQRAGEEVTEKVPDMEANVT
jgi:hypothetical protein